MNKQEVLKNIAESLGESIDDFESARLDKINADIFTLKYDQRGIGGIIIGDDGSNLICGSIHPIEYYIEEFNNRKKDKKDNNPTQYLTRKELAEKFYGYHSKNNINDSTATINYLKILSNFLDKYQYLPNDNFIFTGRKKFIYDEIVMITNVEKEVENPLYFLLGSLEEFIGNNNQIYPSEDDYVSIRAKNDAYIAEGYICQQEKDIVLDIINQISYFATRQNTYR